MSVDMTARYAVAVAALALSLPAASSVSHVSTQSQSPSFRAGIDLVTLDVTVVTQDGHTVEGLIASDFSVKLAGQARPVRILEYLSFPSSGSTLPRQTASPLQSGAGPAVTPRTMVVVVDDVGAQPGELRRLATGMRRMLESLTPADLVGAVTTSGTPRAVDPTPDRTDIRRFLAAVAMSGHRDDAPAGVFIGTDEAIDRWCREPVDWG